MEACIQEDPLNRERPTVRNADELSELGRVALLKFNLTVARYTSSRLFDEGLSSLEDVHVHLQGSNS